jgi:hypothetical protein
MKPLRQIRNTRRFAALLALALACSLAGAASGFARTEASRGVFAVTLQAQLVKTWNYVATRETNDCFVQSRVNGSRTVTLRSKRPTIVTVSYAKGRARYWSGVIRSLGGRAVQSGSVTTVEGGAPGCARSTKRTKCARPRRTLANATVRFFRGGRDRIAFARTRDFAAGLSPDCPPQAQEVRAEGASMHLAVGELSERGLFNTRRPAQTGFASVEETTDFEGDATGKVVVKVNWQLTFRRIR